MKLLILILLIITFTACTNSKSKSNINISLIDSSKSIRFIYSTLAKDTLFYKRIVNFKTIDSFDVRKNTECPNRIFVQEIDKENQVKTITHLHNNICEPPLDLDIIEISGRKFYMDSLLKKTEFNKGDLPTLMGLMDVYKFELKNRKFIVFYMYNIALSTSAMYQLVSLFEITNLNQPIPLITRYQACDDLKCFNDFNHDGNLDFADWNEHEDTLSCYTLPKGEKKFVKLNDRFLKIDEKTFGFYTVDTQNSKWFFSLK